MSNDPTLKHDALQKIRASSIMSGQRYRHYATGNVYVIRDVGLFETSLDPMVSYRRLDAAEDDPVWMRYLTIFRGHAVQDGVLVSRFTLIAEDDPSP